MNAGFIGLGAMGRGMAGTIAKAGLLAGVYNRTAAVAEQLAAEWGVAYYRQPQALAAAVDAVVLCVSADADVLAMVEAVAESIRPGSVVVDMSTVSSGTAKQAAAILAERGAAFLDAPVSGGVEGAKNGTLAMMVGGDAEVLETVRPVLAAVATRIVHIGPVGCGQTTKAVNQILCAGINQAVTEALAFAEAHGLPMERVIDVLAGGAAGNWFLDHRGKTMVRGTFAPGFKLALHHKDLAICQTMAQQAGVALPLTDQTVQDYARLMAQGFGDDDISALYRLKKP